MWVFNEGHPLKANLFSFYLCKQHWVSRNRKKKNRIRLENIASYDSKREGPCLISFLWRHPQSSRDRLGTLVKRIPRILVSLTKNSWRGVGNYVPRPFIFLSYSFFLPNERVARVELWRKLLATTNALKFSRSALEYEGWNTYWEFRDFRLRKMRDCERESARSKFFSVLKLHDCKQGDKKHFQVPLPGKTISTLREIVITTAR